MQKIDKIEINNSQYQFYNAIDMSKEPTSENPPTSSSVNTALNNIIAPRFNLSEGILTATQKILENTHFYYTDYIPVSNKIIFYSNVGSSDKAIYMSFYDQNKSIVGSPLGLFNYPHQEVIYNIQNNNVCYIRATFSKKDIDKVYLYTISQDTTDEIYKVLEYDSIDLKNVENYSGFIDVYGNIATHTDYVYTAPIFLKRGYTISTTLTLTSVVSFITQVDENGNIIKHLLTGVNTNNYKYLFYIEEDMYVSISCPRNAITKSLISIYITNIQKNIVSINETNKHINEIDYKHTYTFQNTEYCDTTPTEYYNTINGDFKAGDIIKIKIESSDEIQYNQSHPFFIAQNKNEHMTDYTYWPSKNIIEDIIELPYDSTSISLYLYTPKTIATPGNIIFTIERDIQQIKKSTGIWDIPVFSRKEKYNINDCVIYNDKIYRFITTHQNGIWNDNDVELTSLYKEIKHQNSTTYTRPTDYTGRDITTFRRILCIGDSLTQGCINKDDDITETYEFEQFYNYPTYLHKMTGTEVVNLGIGGIKSNGWYDIYKDRIESISNFDCCIIQLGVNDVKDTLDTVSREAFINIINLLKNNNKGIYIFLAGIINGKSYKCATESESYYTNDQFIRNLYNELYATDPNVFFIDHVAYGHLRDLDDIPDVNYSLDNYNNGHLSAYGYWRLAMDYHNYISYIMATDKTNVFRNIQFVGTNIKFKI